MKILIFCLLASCAAPIQQHPVFATVQDWLDSWEYVADKSLPQAASEPLPEPASQPASQPGGQKSIVLFSTKTCPACIRERAWLDASGLKYDDIDVDAKYQDFILYGFEKCLGYKHIAGVPTTYINGKLFVGFNPEAIQVELNEPERFTKECTNE